jgi:hypothetical protein
MSDQWPVRTGSCTGLERVESAERLSEAGRLKRLPRLEREACTHCILSVPDTGSKPSATAWPWSGAGPCCGAGVAGELVTVDAVSACPVFKLTTELPADIGRICCLGRVASVLSTQMLASRSATVQRVAASTVTR